MPQLSQKAMLIIFANLKPKVILSFAPLAQWIERRPSKP